MSSPIMGSLFSALSKQISKNPTIPLQEDFTNKSQSKNPFGLPQNAKLDAFMASAFKKKLGIDYLSERAGPDVRKYTTYYLSDKLDRYKLKGKRTVMTREAVIEFAAQDYKVKMTMLSATDAILYCRGT